jgi:oligoendopeptidase F
VTVGPIPELKAHVNSARLRIWQNVASKQRLQREITPDQVASKADTTEYATRALRTQGKTSKRILSTPRVLQWAIPPDMYRLEAPSTWIPWS